MTVHFRFLDEPKLLFGSREMSIDPKLGLSRFGPYRASGKRVQDILIGIIGPEREAGELREWLERCQNPIEGKEGNLNLDPHFPGLGPAFGSRFSVSRSWELLIPRLRLQTSLADSDPLKRFERTVELYCGRVAAAAESQPYPQVILFALPQELLDRCSTVRPGRPAQPRRRTGSTSSRAEPRQLKLFFTEEDLDAIEEGAETKDVYRNFRRAVKIRIMQWGIPIQLATPRLWQDRADAQHPATKAWNFCTGVFFKGGGVPWMWADMPAGTCYVGISFYRPVADRRSVRASLAQVFTDRGEGLVIRGQRFEKEDEYSAPHMPPDLAADLMQKAIESYTTANNGVPPGHLVVHKTSRYWPDELEALRGVASSVPYQTYAALDERDVRFVRYMKDYPPVRGTLCTIDGVEEAFLFTRGSVTIKQSYLGPYVPKPLVIVEHMGDSSLERVATEILGLSKMNWNAALIANFYPITLQFADRVGDILSAAGPDDPIASQFRFYM
jgi:hypothetical protein